MQNGNSFDFQEMLGWPKDLNENAPGWRKYQVNQTRKTLSRIGGTANIYQTYVRQPLKIQKCSATTEICLKIRKLKRTRRSH